MKRLVQKAYIWTYQSPVKTGGCMKYYHFEMHICCRFKKERQEEEEKEEEV